MAGEYDWTQEYTAPPSVQEGPDWFNNTSITFTKDGKTVYDGDLYGNNAEAYEYDPLYDWSTDYTPTDYEGKSLELSGGDSSYYDETEALLDGSGINSLQDYGSQEYKTRKTTSVNTDSWASQVYNYFTGDWFDTHYDIKGKKLGPLDELIVDSLELFDVTIDPLAATHTKNLSGSFVGLALSVLGGAPAGLQALSSVTLGVDVLYARDLISPEKHRQVKALSTIGTFTYASVNFVNSISALDSMAEYLTTGEQVLAYTLTVGMYGMRVKELADALDAFDLPYSEISVSDLAGGFSSTLTSKFPLGTASIPASQLFYTYAEWKHLNRVSSPIDLDDVTKDPFEFMAGGAAYQSQFAGDALYSAKQVRKPTVGINRKLTLDKYDMFNLRQEDSHYKNLEPIDTSTKDDRGRSLIIVDHEYRDLVDVYNESKDTLKAYEDVVWEHLAEYDKLVEIEDELRAKAEEDYEAWSDSWHTKNQYTTITQCDYYGCSERRVHIGTTTVYDVSKAATDRLQLISEASVDAANKAIDERNAMVIQIRVDDVAELNRLGEITAENVLDILKYQDSK